MNDYSVLKLSNGEDLVCRVIEKTDSDIIIESPLKMETMNRMTHNGLTESLSLTRWLQPFSDVKNYTIQKNSVVISVPASIGLSKYYEFILKKLDGIKLTAPTENDIKTIRKNILKFSKKLKLKMDQSISPSNHLRKI